MPRTPDPKRDAAMHKAELAGYSIVYSIASDEVLMMKPSSTLKATGNPDEFACVFKRGSYWGWTVKKDALEE